MGGWIWKRAAAALRDDGHEVYPATLTGLGERVHLARPEVDLETHIADVVNLIAFEDLTGVALAGHSYAGAVVAGVADRIGERLTHLIYVDSAPIENGESLFDFVGLAGDQEGLRRQVEEQGDGWRLPPPPFADLPMSPTFAGLSDADRQLMTAKAVAQPFRTYTQTLRLSGEDAGNYRRAIVACNDFRTIMATGAPRFQQFRSPDWRIEHLETDHWPMLSRPEELADTLHRLVGEGPVPSRSDGRDSPTSDATPMNAGGHRALPYPP
jgi:pimeloyl-ACP methyl ester carboxylesterase